MLAVRGSIVDHFIVVAARGPCAKSAF